VCTCVRACVLACIESTSSFTMLRGTSKPLSLFVVSDVLHINKVWVHHSLG
jgi:hypothetical protein